jgi:hypothetical protein
VSPMCFAAAEAVANAVLYEGYVLYPYRASAAKNRSRFQFGVLAPQAYVEAGGSDAWMSQTECLIEPAGVGVAGVAGIAGVAGVAGPSGPAGPRVDVKVRFLQLQARRVEEATAAGAGFRAVDALDLDGDRLVPWDEGVERHLEVTGIAVRDLLAGERVVPLAVAGGRDFEALRSLGGPLVGRLVRDRWDIAAELRLAAEAVDGGLLRLRVRIENRSPWPPGAALDRDLALRRSLLGAHTLLAVEGGAFVSLLEPPAGAAEAAAACSNLHTWPVLIGPAGTDGSRGLMLSSPIILYDYPAVAAESPGDLCDATEIDEILLLRTMTLTEEEKREARGTDPRARQIVERADSLPPEIFERLHGAMRSLAPPAPSAPSAELAAELASWESFLNPPGTEAPETATLDVGEVRLGSGSRVRLRPSRRADSMDMFLAGRTARVAAVYRDLEDAAYLAVTLDDDPGADLHAGIGRYFYFYPDEVEALA